jgi:hypothetical protein
MLFYSTPSRPTALLSVLLAACLLLGACSSSAVRPPASEAGGALFGLSPEQYEYVRTESAPGGRMDFASNLSAQQLYVVGGVAYNRREMGLVLWAAAVKRLGIRTANEVIALYEAVGTEELGEPQRRALRAGFDRE